MPLAAAEAPPPPPLPATTPDAATVAPVAPTVPLRFLMDYLYQEHSLPLGDVILPYHPSLSVRLTDLLNGDAAKTLADQPPPAAVVQGCAQAEQQIGLPLSTAYIQALRDLAAQLPQADQPLAGKLIDAMVEYQSAQFQPNRLFAPPAPPTPTTPPVTPAAPTKADAPVPPGPPGPGPHRRPRTDAEAREQAQLAQERAQVARSLHALTSAELARVTACLAAPANDRPIGRMTGGSLFLYLGRTPVRLSDLFGADRDFRSLEIHADAAWRRRMFDALFAWKQALDALQSIEAQTLAAQVSAPLRPGLLAVLKAQADYNAHTNSLEHEYQSDELALVSPDLTPADRAAAEKRTAEFPAQMRKLVDGFDQTLETAWTPELEKAFVDFYIRTKRLQYVRDNLHPAAKAEMEKEHGTPGDQF
ncbi:MAG: hypothetical protein ACREJ2_03870 [Planctomycetota bacterium]